MVNPVWACICMNPFAPVRWNRCKQIGYADLTEHVRMIGLALSGGGSRAMAFHLGCFRALEDLGLLEKDGVLSTISGGSVFGAYYAYSPVLD